MDATNNRTIASAFVALLIGSVFLTAIAPTAEATHLGLGGQDITIDVRQGVQTVTIRNGTDFSYPNAWVPTSPAGTKMRALTAYELSFIGLDVRSQNSIPGGYGYTGTLGNLNAQVEIVNASTGNVVVQGATMVTGPDGAGTCTGNVAPGCLKNVTFYVAPTNLQGPGLYQLRVVGTSTIVGGFVVYPNEDLTIGVTTNPSPLIYTGNQVVVSFTSAPNTFLSMRPAGGIQTNPNLFTSAATTDANGQFAFLSTLPMGAGTWEIYAGQNFNHAQTNGVGDARQCLPGQTSSPTCALSVPERMGNTTLTVQANGLGLTAVTTQAFVGFANTVQYKPTVVSTGNQLFKATPDITATTYNLSILSPTNFLYSWNNQTFGTNPATPAGLTCRNLNADPAPPAAPLNAQPGLHTANCVGAGSPTVTIDTATTGATAGFVQITNNTWQSGTYTVTLGLESAGGAATPPEWYTTWQIVPATPSSVTISSTPAVVDVPFANAVPPSTGAGGALGVTSPISAAPGYLEVSLRVSGSTINEHPYCRIRSAGTATDPAASGTCLPNPSGSSSPTITTLTTAVPTGNGLSTAQVSERWEGPDNSPSGCNINLGVNTNHCFMDNITLRGDLLPGWKVVSYDADTGNALLRFTPTRNGTIWVDVNWKNSTTPFKIPVNRGANLTASITNMTVDQTATFTVNVRNAFGGAVESANVWIYQRNTGSNGIPTAGAFQGTGAAFIAGTGGPNAGQGGVYQFTVKPSAVQDLVVYTEIGTAGNYNASYANLTVLPSQTLATMVTPNWTYAGLRTPLTINVSNATGIGVTGTAGQFRAYLLDPVQWRDLLANGTSGLFTGSNAPLGTGATTTAAKGTLFADSQSAAAFFTNVTLLDENDYRLYVCSSATAISDCRTATHDNRQNAPIFNVTRYDVAATPSQIASSNQIQENVQVHLVVTNKTGGRVNGSIRATSGSAGLASGSGSAVTVTNGEANMSLTGTGTVGTLQFEFDPVEDTGTQTNVFAQTNGNISVVAGNLTFNPTKVPIVQSTLVTVRLANFTGAGLPGRVIRLCGTTLNSNFPTTFPARLDTPTDVRANCPDFAVTGADGSTGIVVTPRSLSPIRIYINDTDTQREIPVSAGSLIVTVSPTSPKAGDNVTITVTQGGSASAGARVLVTKNGTSVLDEAVNLQGQATLPSVTEGTYVVTGIRTGFDNGTASFTVGAAPTTNASKFTLSNLVVPAQINVGTGVTVSVDVKNVGNAAGTETAILLVNNAQRDTQSVTLNAGENRTVAYSFTPAVAGTYAITVKIGNETIGPNNVVVGTPVTTTTVTSTTGQVTTSSPVTSTTTTSTSPPVSTTRQVTSTPVTTTETPAEDEPNVPGFEVVALIAALGVAMLVLGRRNRS